MATIKLQPSGKVVLKDGKVACGCCVTCEGCQITVKSVTKEILDVATTGTLNGYPPDIFVRTGTGFSAEWTYYNGSSFVYYQFNYSFNCFFGEGFEAGLELISTVCCDSGPPGYACSDKDLTINGVLYSIHNFFPTGAPDPGPLVPPPIFIFS